MRTMPAAGGGGRAETRGRVLVIGVGNPYRSDDGAGLAAVRLIRAAALPRVDVTEIEGEPTSLIDAWGGASRVVVVDAVTSGAEPGTIHRFDAVAQPPPPPFRHRGTHAFSVADVVELARAVDRLPDRLVVFGIEGAEFGAGLGLSPGVEAAVRATATRVVEELDQVAPGGGH